jgi:hypothetical protein
MQSMMRLGSQEAADMKRVILAVAMAGACVLAAVVSAQQPTGTTAQKPAETTGQASTMAPADVDVPTGALALGTVRLTRSVTADGKPLAAGSYQVRLTPEEAKPAVPGQLEKLERWVEFVQRGQVRGREVVSIVPQSEIGQVADGRPPRAGASKVELLKGNDYLRVWINRGGTHYLIHLPTGMSGD